MIYKLNNRAIKHPVSNQDLPDTFSDDNEPFETRAFFQRRLADGSLVVAPNPVTPPVETK